MELPNAIENTHDTATGRKDVVYVCVIHPDSKLNDLVARLLHLEHGGREATKEPCSHKVVLQRFEMYLLHGSAWVWRYAAGNMIAIGFPGMRTVLSRVASSHVGLHAKKCASVLSSPCVLATPYAAIW